jgi:hypothetical protein
VRPLIVEVPSPLGLRPTGVELAPAALRAAGLHARLGCDDAQHVAVPAYDDRRDAATGVLNPGGIAEVAFSLASSATSSSAASRPHYQAVTKNARQPSGSGRAASGPSGP